jgi:ABC-type multidrug transport system fused ATPase/permease subunit
MECNLAADDVFGPQVHSCRDSDFNLLFEQATLQAVPFAILSTVHTAFCESMIIAVAHRLETLLEYDMIVVLDAGRVVETGNLADLMSAEDGWFKQLMERYG